MLPKTVREAMAAATAVVEEVGKRVVGTATAILERTGVDVAEVERKLGGQFPPSPQALQTLAEEAVTAGRAGVDLAVGVARNEVEKAFEKVGDQVTKVGVVLAYLESKLREVEEEPAAAAAKPGRAGADVPAQGPAPAPRADDLFGHGWEYEDERSADEPIVTQRVEVDEPVEVDPPVAAEPVARKSTPAKEAPASEAPAKKATAEKATAKKAPAKKAPAKKAPAKQTAAKKTASADSARKTATAAKKTAAKKAPAKRTPAKKTASAEGATASKTTAVRKTTSPKEPDARDE
ncbi:histone H1-like repetitive region-containing protein [Kitasatospora sp. NPDC001539]|uniref:histone H1-like repetitive region-containing protein n=1 Tax=Kitasatospora sp. NPDC001539 TaxID=3154384 RepID=UPI0033267EF9